MSPPTRSAPRMAVTSLALTGRPLRDLALQEVMGGPLGRAARSLVFSARMLVYVLRRTGRHHPFAGGAILCVRRAHENLADELVAFAGAGIRIGDLPLAEPDSTIL